MVLEGSTTPKDGSFPEQPPSSDFDPYADNGADSDMTRPAIMGRVSLSDIPYRLPFMSDPFKDSEFLGILSNVQRQASATMGRPVNQQEADALTFYAAKGWTIAGYGAPVGSTTALALWMRSNRTAFRFPFWSPFKEGSRFSPDRFGPLTGLLARRAWLGASLTTYSIIGILGGQIFFTSLGLSSAAAGRARDPRLSEWFTAVMAESRARAIQQRQARERAGQSDAPQPGETAEMARQRRSVQRAAAAAQAQQPAKQVSRAASADDDMSPTGGAFRDDFVGDAADGGLLDDAQLSRRQASREPRRQDSDAADAWMQPQTEGTSPSQQKGRQAGRPQPQQSGRTPPAGQQADGGQSGSAWDRLRQQAMSGQSEQPRPAQQPWQEAGDRNQQRQAEQREFDARIERERVGKDFEESSKGEWRR